MKTKHSLLVSIFAFFVLAGCGDSSPSVLENSKEGFLKYDMSKVITVGNQSFIPLSLKGRPHEHALTILDVVREFETIHPHLEVDFSFKDIEYERIDNGIFIRGLWLSHKIKESLGVPREYYKSPYYKFYKKEKEGNEEQNQNKEPVQFI